ncbi:MAG TPA: universal stress protein [Verrucomicrobiae bacterium]|jgi:nucleotide-binding universal stress UspA family protein|nr:universal stress protein [Verrucomicrobiae bacterium]
MATAPQVARITLRNILFPTDFSPASSAALPFALSLAKMYGSTLLMAHALSPAPHLQVIPDHVPEEDDWEWEDARDKLDACTHDPLIGDTRCKTLLNRGDLSSVIPTMIQEHSVDLVVLGTHGRRGVSKLVLGSGAERIYRSATCPVLTIGPKAQKAGAEWSPRRILCPVDIAEISSKRQTEPALHYALSLAEENEAQFLLMHAIPLVPWQHRDAVGQQTREVLERLLPPQASDWCTPDLVVRYEPAVEAILHIAVEREVDLIVMGVHKARAAGLSAHLPWPIASEIVSRAICPVLTIRV